MDINQKMDVKEAKRIYEESHGKIAGESQGYVSLRHIDKVYGKGNQAVYDFSFDVKKGEFVALVGPSGCGKSTTLRMIAGLEDITAGELYLNGVLSNYLPSKDRDIAMVFQSYALYPQLNVYDNIAFGLKIRKVDKSIIQEKVFKAADILDLGDYLDRYPRELSGGQMQRVALGRAIVRDASRSSSWMSR
jgi:multiple sugar transport system ATP-binding protein